MVPALAGLPLETDAVAALGVARRTGDPEAAATAIAAFEAATELHLPYLRRCAWRCQWGAAEAERAVGRDDDARRRLLALETELVAAGHQPLLLLVRRSLRPLGVSRSTRSPAPPGDLTATQRRVLELVAAGRSSPEIAEVLKISVATVDTHVRNAMRRAGARTRIEAARMVLTDGHAS